MILVTALNIIVVIMAYQARFPNYRYLLACAFLLLALVLGIRYGYGNDYMSYKYFFDHGFPDVGADEDVETGWYLLNKLFKPFGFPALVFFLTFVEHLMIYDIIRKNVDPEWYWLSVFIYVFNPYYMLVGLSMMRQFFVQVLGLYAVSYLVRERYLTYVVIVLFASLFHKVSFLLLFLLFVPYVIRITKSSWGIIVLLIAIFVSYLAVWKLAQFLFPLIAELSGSYASKYLNSFILSDEYKIGLKTIVCYVIYVYILLRNINNLDDCDKYYPVEVLFALFILPFALIFPMASRISWIFSFAEIISLPILFKKDNYMLVKPFICLVLIIGIQLLSYREFFYSEVYGEHFMYYKTILSY